MVGGGAAGLHAALEAAQRGAQVVLVSRKPLSESASFWAQGGLAGAVAPDDSPARHAEDTINAGRAACRASAVSILVDAAPGQINLLIEREVAFDREPDGSLSLGLEGGHSARRIVHVGGSETGRAITQTLAGLTAKTPAISVREGVSALALWSQGSRCHGVITDRGAICAPATVLATGGAAALWQRTTNPWGAIGAGSVLAAAAGADLADLELCQFHPTALALPGNPRDGALITEAIRGEGAALVDRAGRRFTDELAPRDQVSGAILDRIDADGAGSVGLDLRGIDLDHFATVKRTLAEAGLDPSLGPIPVAPAAHYTMGGIKVDLDAQSSLPGLFAVGECSCTGLHGANRLASNSLSECFVFGSRAAAAADRRSQPADPTAPLPNFRFVPPMAATREAVWKYAGPRRRADQLERLLEDPYPLAAMIARAALERRESRGPHRRVDAPRIASEFDGVHLVRRPDGEIVRERWT